MSRLPVNQPYVSQASASPSQIASFQRSPSSLFDGGMRLGQSLQRFGAGLHQKEKEKAIKLENARRNKFLAQTTPLMHEIENDFKQQLFHLVNDPDNQGADLQSTARDFTETWIQNIDRIIEGKGSHKKIEGLVDLGHDPDNPFTDSDSWSATGQLDKLKSRLWGTLSASMPTIQQFENNFIRDELHSTIKKNVTSSLQSVSTDIDNASSSLSSSLSQLSALSPSDRLKYKSNILKDYLDVMNSRTLKDLNLALSEIPFDGISKGELNNISAFINSYRDIYKTTFGDNLDGASAFHSAAIEPIKTFLSKFSDISIKELIPSKSSSKLSTYNVRNYNFSDRWEDGKYRTDQEKTERSASVIIQEIANEEPTTLSLQEVGGIKFVREIQKRLKDEHGINYPYLIAHGEGDRQLSFLSKTPIKGAKHYSLPESSRGVSRITIGEGDSAIDVFNVHLKSKRTVDSSDPESREQRQKEATAISSLIKGLYSDPSARFIISGDFNDSPDSPALASFLDFDLVPSFDEDGNQITHNFARDGVLSSFDRFYASKSLSDSLKSQGYISSGDRGMIGSDHRMVSIDLPIDLPTFQVGQTVGQYLYRNMDKGMKTALGESYPDLISLLGKRNYEDHISQLSSEGRKIKADEHRFSLSNSLNTAKGLTSSIDYWLPDSVKSDLAFNVKENIHKAASSIKSLSALGEVTLKDSVSFSDSLNFAGISGLLDKVARGQTDFLPLASRFFTESDGKDGNEAGLKWFNSQFLDKNGQLRNDRLTQLVSLFDDSIEGLNLPTVKAIDDALFHGFYFNKTNGTQKRKIILDNFDSIRNGIISIVNKRNLQFRQEGHSMFIKEFKQSNDPNLRSLASDHSIVYNNFLKSYNEQTKKYGIPEYNALLSSADRIQQQYGYNLSDITTESWTKSGLYSILDSSDFPRFQDVMGNSQKRGFSYGKFLDDLASTRSGSLLKGYPFALKVIGQQSLDNFASSNFDAIDNDTNVSNSWKEVEDAMRGKRLFITGMSFDRGVSNAPDVLALFNNALFSNPTGDTHYKRRAISSKAKQIAKRWAHVQMNQHGMSAKDVADRFADQLSTHRWIISNGSYYPIDFGSRDTPEGGEFQPVDFFRFYDESTSLSRDMNTPDYVGEITKRKWGTSLFEVDGHKLWAGNQKLNLVEKIPTFAQKAKGVFDDLFGSEKTFLTESLERETRWIIDPDSGYATLGYNTSDNIKNGYKQIQPMFLEKDGELSPIQIPLDEFFHELRDISSDLVNKYPGLYYKAKK